MSDINNLRHLELKSREEIASKIGRIIASDSSASDKEAAFELARTLVEDAAVSVRSALAAELRVCNFLPPELVSSLVNDVDEISLPFLVASDAMDDEFLEDIIRNCGDNAQEAVATRQGISEAVSYAICDVACKSAVEILMENETAEVSERGSERVMERFPEERSLLEKLSQRSDLPADLAERIIFKVSRQFGEYLVKKFRISTDYASYLASIVNRQVFNQTLEMAPLSEVENYLKQLRGENALNSDVLLNYMQSRNVRLFTAAIAVLIDKPFSSVEPVLARGDKKIMARLFETAGFSKSVVGVLLIAYERLLRGH
ncbi:MULTISPECIES: DUF2336 domain-containing protein [Kordiimonas]|uniref:DUF2336 domain-containing protein n=1 Tax=Kordiimonas TaxID=288021 RepID=UPI001FF0FDC1|nr:DUF2336 domain-containing protein [Kordiimonas sp. SCSIO 12603]MCK0069712.1 DUF2336 domain-containing protein [Kordiimonas laminariae]UTW57177.1 DUF2336 domain-containing protein [Kordiimonas sp. SCSIO 12603]